MAPRKSSTLADAFAGGPDVTIKGPRCSVGRLLTEASPADVEVLRGVLADQAWTNARIAERLRGAGLRVSMQSVQRHRRGECLCSTLGIA